MTERTVTGIEIDLASNTLRLVIDDSPHEAMRTSETEQPASIDIGAGGRLIGVALGDAYVPVMEPEAGTETLVRSAEIDVVVMAEADSGRILTIVVPRRGEGFEITYPSGNQ